MHDNSNPFAPPQQTHTNEIDEPLFSHRVVDAWQDDRALVVGPNCELPARCVKCNSVASRGLVLAPATLWQCRFRVGICFLVGCGVLWAASYVFLLGPVILAMSACFTLCVTYVARMESNAAPLRFGVCDSHFVKQHIVRAASFATTLIVFVATLLVIEDWPTARARQTQGYTLQEVVLFAFFAASTFFNISAWVFWFDPTTVRTDGHYRWIRGLDSAFLDDLPKWKDGRGRSQ